ncbi:MMPL family transporter OS=Streptomyces alboniger OX=132473 GN=CP975_04540 PE=4 SV=1 [Streptomyces alboniger]
MPVLRRHRTDPTADTRQTPPNQRSCPAGRHPRTVIAAWLLVCATCAVLAGTLFSHLVGGGFTATGAESEQAQTQAQARFGVGRTDVLLLFRSTEQGPAGPRLAAAAREAAAAPAVARITDPPDAGAQGIAHLAKDGASALVPLVLAGHDEETKRRTLGDLRQALQPPDGVTVSFGGPLAFLQEASARSQDDLVRAELLAAPLLMLLLLLIFRGFAAALLPMLTGAAAVTVGLASLRIATEFTDISAFAVNLVSMLGLGLAVDYALLIVSRYRRERAHGGTAPEALTLTMRTAGRTILITSAVVTAALAVLALFPLTFMRSLAIGGCAVVVADAAVALTLLPALMTLLGTRIDARPRSRRWRRNLPTGRPKGTLLHRLATRVSRRPTAWLLACTVILLTLATPALRTTFGGITEETLQPPSASRSVLDETRTDFPFAEPPRIQAVVLLAAPAHSATGRQALRAWMDRLEALPTGPRATVTASHGHAALVSAGTPGQPNTDRETVRAIRALKPPPNASILVGGTAAVDTDMTDALRHRLPLVVGLVLAITSLLLLLAFRSVLVPVKALVTSALATFACLGAMTWVFQDGHFASVLDFSPIGYIETTQPVVVLVVLFALSVDYELFLLSRVREEYKRTGDNTRAVVVGLQDTGTVITGAATLLLVVIGALISSDVIAIKEVGVGLFAGVLIDATLVRLLLVPAAMFLAGRANWWPAGTPLQTHAAEATAPQSPAAPHRSPADHITAQPAHEAPQHG